MILELEGTQRMSDPLDRIRDRMRVVIHRVDAPFVACLMVDQTVPDAIQGRIAHIDIRRCHVDTRTQRAAAIRKLTGAHTPEKIQVFLDRTFSVGALSARFSQGAPVVPHLLGREITHKGLACLDQFNGIAVQLLEIVRGETQIFP